TLFTLSAAFVSTLLLGLTSPADAQRRAEKTSRDSVSTPGSGSVSRSGPSANTTLPRGVTVRTEEDPPNAYAIGIGDVVEISVWKSPELGVTVPVRPDGRISVPLLGDIQAAGMTPLALKGTLTDGFQEFVTAPEVSVVIKEINSRKVFVTGEVVTPGAYDLQPRTKLTHVLALAGGLTPYAKRKAVILRDRGGEEDRRYTIDLDGIISGKKPKDNVVLMPGDTIIFP
ncbi:MAG TPA: polysaccharide biosynthesis/export family protein, partial [Thermoanaerobaculia bacterium]|nr:polysaccharide biosynthesis/export family protein [Thermoanaerobaculia bacterium]